MDNDDVSTTSVVIFIIELCILGCPLFRKMSLMDFIMGDMLRLYVKVTQKKFLDTQV